MSLPMSDARSRKLIETLERPIRSLALLWLSKTRQAGIPAVITSGTRTYEEQAKLYAQGRTLPGKKVTNAKPGFSNHNFGVAWDFTIFQGVDEKGGTGKPIWESPLYKKAGLIAESLGLKWGGRFTNVDEPHIEYKTGLSMAAMRERKARGEAIV